MGVVSQVIQRGVSGNKSIPSQGDVYNYEAVNFSFRDGEAKVREPFRSLLLEFEDEETESVFKSGNVTGCIGYKRTIPGTQGGVVVSVADRIIFFRIAACKAFAKTIYTGIEPNWEHSFFVQAENILVWQNGKQTPVFWDGLTEEAAQLTEDIVDNPMPIGNIMSYSDGRIFVATENDLVYASDYIYSLGIGGRNLGVLNFTETTYPQSGDGFGAYSDIGEVTGMISIPAYPSVNGHGEVIVFGPNGAWSINSSVPRNQWLDQVVQRKVMKSRGSFSPNSVAVVNSDIWFRSSDGGISSFISTVSDNRTKWTNSPMSKEISRLLSYDGPHISFSGSIFNSDRLYTSFGIRKKESNGYGMHRYALGIAVADFNPASRSLRIEDEGFSWDGAYTGPRVTAMCNLLVSSKTRAFFLSFDSDGENRIYETYDGEDDLVDGQPKKINAILTSSALLRDLSKDLNQKVKRTEVKFSARPSGGKIGQMVGSFSGVNMVESIQLTEIPPVETEDKNEITPEIEYPLSGSPCSNVPVIGDGFRLETEVYGRLSLRSITIDSEDSSVNFGDRVKLQSRQIQPKKDKTFQYNF